VLLKSGERFNQCLNMKTRAKLTCPYCHKEQEADMPIDACQYFYKCLYCQKIIKPKEGDCCVFCSYSDTKCPPKQMATITQHS